MIPGIETLLGSILGGGFRFLQAWMESREKQRDRDHEHRMMELQGNLAEKADERRFRELGVTLDHQTEIQVLHGVATATQAQSSEAKEAGGSAGWLSATIRPLTTYFLLIFYLFAKITQIVMAWQTQGLQALVTTYNEADMALLSAVLGFWFVNRSMMRGRSSLGS